LHGVKGISKNPDFAIQILPYVITKKSKNASLSSLRAACGEVIQYCGEYNDDKSKNTLFLSLQA
jgi:hypothetical protein